MIKTIKAIWIDYWRKTEIMLMMITLILFLYVVDTIMVEKGVGAGLFWKIYGILLAVFVIKECVRRMLKESNIKLVLKWSDDDGKQKDDRKVKGKKVKKSRR